MQSVHTQRSCSGSRLALPCLGSRLACGLLLDLQRGQALGFRRLGRLSWSRRCLWLRVRPQVQVLCLAVVLQRCADLRLARASLTELLHRRVQNRAPVPGNSSLHLAPLVQHVPVHHQNVAHMRCEQGGGLLLSGLCWELLTLRLGSCCLLCLVALVALLGTRQRLGKPLGDTIVNVLLRLVNTLGLELAQRLAYGSSVGFLEGLLVRLDVAVGGHNVTHAGLGALPIQLP
mmetsp:Transcript_41322/g.123394  ORF Transcript_41322/g.123394 Transcript_41322/m.123394 type:complete len:231 (-) Transcript_41322:423-1115(-)